MRLLALIPCLPILVFAQDAREIVRRACELDQKNVEIARNYTFLQRQAESDLDGSGQVKNKQIRTWDVTLQEGSPYKRLVGRNDQPLSEAEQKAEDAKLQGSIEVRRKETPTERDRRIAEWHRRQQHQREALRELPDAFDFRLVGEEALNGGEVYVIDATPRPGYKPRSSSTAFLTKVKSRMWIDKRDYQWVKVDMETLDTISFGGFLLRLAKGGRLVMEQTRVNGEVWLPKHIALQASARLLLVKGYRKSLDIAFSDYKKFQTDSRMVSSEDK